MTTPGPASPGTTPAEATPVSAARGEDPAPLLPERSAGDTDAAWGDRPEQSDDRLYRDRPPHWDDF
jgi:hypothetical protein